MIEKNKKISMSPSAIFWRYILRNRMAMTGGIILIVFYLLAFLANFFAPYGMETQNRTLYYCSPTWPHFVDSAGSFHIRPFVYGKVLTDRKLTKYGDDTSKIYPIKFFMKGEPYKFLGIIPCERHFFGVEGDGRRLC